MERVDGPDPDVGEEVAFVAPVDLGLGTRDDLEAAVQPGQRVLIGFGELSSDPRPRLDHQHLHPLVGPGEAVLGDQPLMDHGRLDGEVLTKQRLHNRHERGNHPQLGTSPRRRRGRDRGSILFEVLPDGAPITTALAADLSKGCARFVQGAKTTNIHPGLRIQDHE